MITEWVIGRTLDAILDGVLNKNQHNYSVVNGIGSLIYLPKCSKLFNNLRQLKLFSLKRCVYLLMLRYNFFGRVHEGRFWCTIFQYFLNKSLNAFR